MLPEKFMEKHENKINWHYISKYQTLSEKFIEKYENKIDKKIIMENEKIINYQKFYIFLLC
jgi:hypothetical protein